VLLLLEEADVLLAVLWGQLGVRNSARDNASTFARSLYLSLATSARYSEVIEGMA